jgi:hypothetical protein
MEPGFHEDQVISVREIINEELQDYTEAVVSDTSHLASWACLPLPDRES